MPIALTDPVLAGQDRDEKEAVSKMILMAADTDRHRDTTLF